MFPCVNCATPVSPEKAQLFCKVFVCPTCYRVAEGALAHANRDLDRLRLMVLEVLRVALMEGKLHLAAGDSPSDVPKVELLQEIVRLVEKKKNATAAPLPVPGHVHVAGLLGKG